MIVYQMIVTAKGGQTQELVDLVLAEDKAEIERGRSAPSRAYTANIGPPFNQVILEWEYVDLAEYERMWTEWAALPSTPAFMEKWRELAEPDFTSRIWSLHTH
jgi:hypothetical protein